jgi:hypothetical protein
MRFSGRALAANSYVLPWFYPSLVDLNVLVTGICGHEFL